MPYTIPMAIGLTLTVTLTTSLASGQQVRLAEVDRQTALTHLRNGQEALAVERFDDAEREFREAIRLHSRLELAHYGLGQVFMATKRYEPAVDAFVSCRNLFHLNVAEDQDERLTYERRLDDQIQSKRDELGALQSGRVRMSNPTSSVDRVRNELGQLQRLRQRSREPIGGIPPFILTALGSAYFRTGAFADAEREWRQAVAVDPNIGEVHNNLAVVLMLTARYDEAEREILLAEKAGFRVSPAFKEDLKAKKAGKRSQSTFHGRVGPRGALAEEPYARERGHTGRGGAAHADLHDWSLDELEQEVTRQSRVSRVHADRRGRGAGCEDDSEVCQGAGARGDYRLASTGRRGSEAGGGTQRPSISHRYNGRRSQCALPDR